MNSFSSSLLRSALLSSALVLAAPLFGQAHGDHHSKADKAAATSAPAAKAGKLVRATDKDAAFVAQASKDYPLDVCVTSDEKLGSMGDAAKFIYKVEGQPDRLVLFCCAGCEDDFAAAPAKYLAKIDAAKTAKAKGAKGKSGK